MKQKTKVFIVKESDGSYSSYMDERNNLPYALVGEGKTVAEAIEEWYRAYNDMKKIFEDEGEEFFETEFEFVYDVPSFLSYYSGKLTYSGLSKVTGVSASQLSHYAHGVRNPSPKTTEKIQKALNTFGRELSTLQIM